MNKAVWVKLKDPKKAKYVGVAVTNQMVIEETEGGKAGPRMVTGVIWFIQDLDEDGFETLSPSNQAVPTFHSPEELQAIAIYEEGDWGSTEEEEEEFEDSETLAPEINA